MAPRSAPSEPAAARPRGHADAAQAAIALFRTQAIEALTRLGPVGSFMKVILGARAILEDDPQLYGKIHAGGTRDAGTIEHAAISAAREYEEVGRSFILRPTEASARVPARVFMVIAQGHPYFDGNKRTALLSCANVAAMLGFEVLSPPPQELVMDVRQLASGEAGVEEVAGWLRDRILGPPGEGKRVIYRRDPPTRRAIQQDSTQLPAELQQGALLIAGRLSPLLKALED